MTDRTDHAAEALPLASYGTSPNAGSPEVGALLVAEAQVHATLALVEQQRIANLIAIAGWVADSQSEEVGFDLDTLRMGVAGEVWEALGLAQTPVPEVGEPTNEDHT